MLKQRIITALVLVVVAIAAIFFLPTFYFSIFVAVVVLRGAWEWCQFLSWQGLSRLLYVLAIGGALVAISVWQSFTVDAVRLDQAWVFWLVLAAGIWWACVVGFVALYPRSKPWRNIFIQAVIGILILVSTWVSIVFLHAQNQGEWLIIIVAVTVVLADTGAFFVGRQWGKRKLAPNVSPGKSWEGFFGGFICSGLFAFILAAMLGDFDQNYWLIIIVLGTSLVSVYGDLLESMLKRECGIKDSGNILPGHGGVLDRIDSIVAAMPVFTLIYLLSGWHL